ncbi:PLDc N-terminal domain-containing protein [Streptoalloteichus hindustanus]|uniref:Phospholipase_D-nuclease N-terminal n=1 Tax=Streptoalloteichus hindustanus TaxID=2017 RepID=A0A1M4TAV3_STRHI|nr:PLDc N-terminal domain-containing protein [Streptoalloteichus hindustanus]SHE41377.1 Phospholipase_D-nuclease N-terminal [Streptoalloteichus hindustanus]
MSSLSPALARSPLRPAQIRYDQDYDEVWGWGAALVAGLGGLLYLALLVVTVVSVLRSPLSIGKKVLWVLIALFSQPLGILLWFAVGRTVAHMAPSAVTLSSPPPPGTPPPAPPRHPA